MTAVTDFQAPSQPRRRRASNSISPWISVRCWFILAIIAGGLFFMAYSIH